MNGRGICKEVFGTEITNEIIYRNLLRHLARTNRVATISEQFSRLKNNFVRVNFVYELLAEYDLLPMLLPDRKDNGKAVDFRQLGNEMYKVKKNKEARELYTKSLVYCEKNSGNISLALANRSAVLFEYGLYEECLKDIKYALEHDYPEKLRWKLEARREKAEKLKFKNTHSNAEPLPRIPRELQSDLIESASNLVEIRNSNELGRHVVAKRNIQVGEILAVEKPFCHILINHFYDHCHECLQVSYHSVSCGNCTQVLYCSEECRDKAQYYHKYECSILKTLRNLQLNKLKMLPLKICLVVKDMYHLIQDLNRMDIGEKYYSSRYKEIHNLMSNTEKRSVSDLFERSASTAVMYHLVKTYTHFFQKEEEEIIFKDILLHHLQTAPSNFHEISEISANTDQIYELDEIGAGAYSFLSLFNHSCSPNVVRHCHGNVIVLRAIQTIKEGEQCNDNYGYHYALMNKQDRKMKLKDQYYFDCNCEVCLHDWPSLRELPVIETDIGIEDQDFLLLQKGDLECAKRIVQNILPRISELEVPKPNRNHAEMQEVLKQCYALFGNIRRTF
ncbi:SET and MYND domain-containing protein 4-like [Leptinotarsa decemlineata]|uniref:SET and MYND domain-containing protein 4-like n=1 Tax=Leptinotarsa decemlineata TaxID=7539 RepID=UPI003D30BA1B